MRGRCLLAACTATCVLVLLPVLGQSPSAQGGQKPAAPPRPAPRTADGTINFWIAVQDRKARGTALTAACCFPSEPEEVGLRDDATDLLLRRPGHFPKPKFSQVPFQPWARALYIFRTQHEFEPYTRCKPAGGARMVATAYGTDFIHVPEQKRIYITQTGGPHSFRPIFMDGRPHPKDLDPSYYGHSVGHWEGDTLVIDTIGFNERSWIDLRGLPTTEATSPDRTHHAPGFQHAALRNHDRRSRRLYKHRGRPACSSAGRPEPSSSSSSARTAILLPLLMIGGREREVSNAAAGSAP